MIFSAYENIMNGTVSISTNSFGVEAENFESAKWKMIKRIQELNDAIIITENDELLSWEIKSSIVSTFGVLENKSMTIL